jgi:hypothetical protein
MTSSPLMRLIEHRFSFSALALDEAGDRNLAALSPIHRAIRGSPNNGTHADSIGFRSAGTMAVRLVGAALFTFAPLAFSNRKGAR